MIFVILALTSCADRVTKHGNNNNEYIESYQAVNCDDAPKHAILSFDSPINKWALIFCSPNEHTVAPVDGYIWLTKQTIFFRSFCKTK